MSDPRDLAMYLESLKNKTGNNSGTIRLPPLEALSEPYQLFLVALYTLTAIIAFFGNAFALLVLFGGKRTSSDLRKYLANLAITDLSLAIFSIPFTYADFMFGRWMFASCLCPFVQFITITAVFVSVYTLIAIGFGRYIAIVYPLRLISWVDSHTTTIIVIIWISGVSIACPQLIQTRAVEFQYGPDTFYDCRENWEGQMSSKIYTIINFVVLFFLPFALLAFLYGSIGWTMIKRISPGNADSSRDEAQEMVRLKVVKMLVTLVIAFAVCWLPINTFNLLVWLDDDIRMTKTRFQRLIFVGSFYVCHWLSMAHSFINPFIYCFMTNNCSMKDVRNAIRRLLKLRSDQSMGRCNHSTVSQARGTSLRCYHSNGYVCCETIETVQ